MKGAQAPLAKWMDEHPLYHSSWRIERYNACRVTMKLRAGPRAGRDPAIPAPSRAGHRLKDKLLCCDGWRSGLRYGHRYQIRSCEAREPRVFPLSGIGPFETCRRTLKESGYWGRPEVIGVLPK
jgi:hypothetical protein